MRPETVSLGLLPSGSDPVGEWLVHRQPPEVYIGQMAGRRKGGEGGVIQSSPQAMTDGILLLSPLMLVLVTSANGGWINQMAYEGQDLRLFDGDRRGRRPPPGLKSFLVTLNLQMDWLLANIENITWESDPIISAAGETEIERLTLALEDRWFFQHAGIDYRAVPRVLRQLITFKRVGGVSTIEQQLVRTILERRERTIRRKSRELMLAWILSHRLSKRDILRVYLSTAYFGYRLRGCDQASEVIFSMQSPDLNKEQAAFIASLLVYPLPKVVLLFSDQQNLHPITNMNAYFDTINTIAPRWTQRVRRRINYGLARRCDSK